MGLMWHFGIGCLCLILWTLPFDITNYHPWYVVPVAVVIGILGMIGSAYISDKKAGRI